MPLDGGRFFEAGSVVCCGSCLTTPLASLLSAPGSTETVTEPSAARVAGWDTVGGPNMAESQLSKMCRGRCAKPESTTAPGGEAGGELPFVSIVPCSDESEAMLSKKRKLW